MGMNQHTRGTAINRMVHGIHLLSGHFGTPGDGPQSLTGQPSACGTAREVGTIAHLLPGGLLVAKPEHRHEAEEIWNLPAGRINATPGYHTVAMWKKFSTPTAQGGDIDTIWVQVTNPAQSLPNRGSLFDPSRRLADKFLIVSDVYPTATVREADLVLPSAMWVEKNGMVGNSERRTQQWFKMVNPPGEARADVWQTLAVARKLFDLGVAGMRDREGNFLFKFRNAQGAEVPAWDYAHFTDVNVDEQLFEEYRRFSVFKHKNLAPYGEYVRARGPALARGAAARRPMARDPLPLRRGRGPQRRRGSTAPVLSLGHARRPRAGVVPRLRGAARGPRRGVSVLALHRAACSSTGTRAR